MNARRVAIGDMFGWIGKTFSMLFANPGTLFGASALMLVVVVLTMLPVFFVMGPMFAMAPGSTPDIEGLLPRILTAYAVMLVLYLILMPPLILGWMRLARDLDQGRSPGATGLFQVFSDSGLWLAGLRLNLLVLLLVVVGFALFAAVFWTSGSAFFAQAAEAQAARAAGMEPAAQGFPAGLVLAYFAFLFVMCFFQFASFLGYTEMAVRGGGAINALSAGLRAVASNFLGLLLWIIVVGIVSFLAILLVMFLVGLLTAVLMAISPGLGVAVIFALEIPLILLMYPLMHVGTYVAWKDMLGGDMEAAAEQAGELAV